MCAALHRGRPCRLHLFHATNRSFPYSISRRAVHERSVDADLALALCRVAQTELRAELRLLVMSATLGSALAPAVCSLLGDCPSLSSSGRSFPVSITHVPGSRPLGLAAAGHPRDLMADVANAVIGVLSASPSGDVLVFLPGEREIRGVQSLLSDDMPASALTKLLILPLYGALPFDQQQAAIAPADPLDSRRRVILSTSLAESSLCVAGISTPRLVAERPSCQHGRRVQDFAAAG